MDTIWDNLAVGYPLYSMTYVLQGYIAVGKMETKYELCMSDCQRKDKHIEEDSGEFIYIG